MRLLLLALLVLLTGCGSSPWADLTRELNASNPSGDIREPDGPALRLALNGRATYARLLQESGNRKLWRSASGLVVATEGGRVVATSGAGEILVTTRFDGADPLTDPNALLDEVTPAHRSIDLMGPNRTPESMRFGVSVECRMVASRSTDPAFLLVEEQCRAPSEGQFTNRFWVEAESGAVVRAEQWIGPGVGMLGVEFL
jgi:hypothetical protein